MKFTFSWLKRHLETTHSASEIADKLTWLGLEVESLADPAEKLGAFTVAYVKSAEKHPNADRLKVAIVETAGGDVQVVCGAPNCRAGIKGVFAPPGTHVPGTGVDLKISKIRDVESRGMLCSKRELQLSDEHDGIIELPADAPLGMKYADYAGLADPVFEVKLTPNRPDCTSVRGIARDLAAAGMGTLKAQKIPAVKGAFKSPINVKLNLPEAAKNACPYFVGRYFKNVTNKPSPAWLQKYLTAIGLRPISALVDITNFITFDQGRPLHVFDADKVKGDIQARFAKANEKIMALNGKEYTLDETMTVIADNDHAEAIAGIMGGEATGCSETTKNVFLECAFFDASRTTLTGRKLNVLSDARYRFERGVDPAAMIDGAEMATQMILELCGGEASELVIAGQQPNATRKVTLPFTRCKTLGGLDVPVDEQKALLEAIGCHVDVMPAKAGIHDKPSDKNLPAGPAVDPRLRGDDGYFTVTLPTYRPDMVGAADCVEEILRIKGFENIPPVSLPRSSTLTVPAFTVEQKRASTARRQLAARGLMEAVTWSFMPGQLASSFAQGKDAVRLVNPISNDLDVMRPSILPNLLQAAQRNAARGFPDAALFELGPIYLSAKPEDQKMVATGIRAGVASPRQWTGKQRPPDLYDAKADVLAVLEALRAPSASLQATPDAPGYYHPGRSGVLRLGPVVLAAFGEVHPSILQKVDLEGPVAAFEIYLDAIPAARETGPAKPLADLPELMPLTRDFAFVVAHDVEADKLVKAIRGADKALIADVRVFDLYEGKGVAEGHKSIAIEVRLQPRGKTLSEQDLEAFAAKVVAFTNWN